MTGSSEQLALLRELRARWPEVVFTLHLSPHDWDELTTDDERAAADCAAFAAGFICGLNHKGGRAYRLEAAEAAANGPNEDLTPNT